MLVFILFFIICYKLSAICSDIYIYPIYKWATKNYIVKKVNYTF
jgi:hypothetical protein